MMSEEQFVEHVRNSARLRYPHNVKHLEALTADFAHIETLARALQTCDDATLKNCYRMTWGGENGAG